MRVTRMERLPTNSLPDTIIHFKGESFEIYWQRFIRNSASTVSRL
jgi:hypothetical protein